MLHHILTTSGIQNTKNKNVTNHMINNKKKNPKQNKSLSSIQPCTWRLKILKITTGAITEFILI